jgi:hypothetical protein
MKLQLATSKPIGIIKKKIGSAIHRAIGTRRRRYLSRENKMLMEFRRALKEGKRRVHRFLGARLRDEG